MRHSRKIQLLDDETLKNRFVALWAELERRYADKPSVAFELLNEVRDVDADKWNALCSRTLAAIRGLNPERLVIVGGTQWNSARALDKMKTYDDPNVFYTFHMYEPFEFTHQRGVLQAPTLYYNRALSYPCADVERYRDYHRVVCKIRIRIAIFGHRHKLSARSNGGREEIPRRKPR